MTVMMSQQRRIDHHNNNNNTILQQNNRTKHERNTELINPLNLSVIDEAYGLYSDLYLDVLHIKPNVGSAQIQEAYFDRRNELFHILSEINTIQQQHINNPSKVNDDDDDDDEESVIRHHVEQQYIAERKMDAVVCAVRILGDPDLRLQYDDIRTERIRLSLSNGDSRSVDGTRNRNTKSNGRNSSNFIKPPSPPNAEFLRKSSSLSRVDSNYKSALQSIDISPPPSPVPDMIDSTGTTSNNTSAFMGFFHSTNETTLNISNYFETTMNSYYSTKTDPLNDQSDDDDDIDNNVGSRRDVTAQTRRSADKDASKVVHKNSSKSFPTSSTNNNKRRNLQQPATLTRSNNNLVAAAAVPSLPSTATKSTTLLQQQQERLYQRDISTGTMTVGDGSTTQVSKESTLYYDDEEEDDTYYTMDEDYDDDDDEYDDASTLEQRDMGNKKSKRTTGKNNKTNSTMSDPISCCLDHKGYYVDRIRVELLDAIDDTMNAFEQVVHVFTLQENDIAAVMSRIDKAKRQINKTHIFYPSSNPDETITYHVDDGNDTDDMDYMSKKKALYSIKQRTSSSSPPLPVPTTTMNKLQAPTKDTRQYRNKVSSTKLIKGSSRDTGTTKRNKKSS